MPFNNCHKCGNLFHFLEPTSLAGTEQLWPGDLDQVCAECRKTRVSDASDEERAKKGPADTEEVAPQLADDGES